MFMTLENTDQALSQVLDTIRTAVETHGNEAVALAGQVYQLEAMETLVSAVALLVFTSISIYVSVRLAYKANDIYETNNYDFKVVPVTIGAIVSSVAAFVLGIGSLIESGSLFSPIVWAAASDPQIALARELLGKL